MGRAFGPGKEKWDIILLLQWLGRLVVPPSLWMLLTMPSSARACSTAEGIFGAWLSPPLSLVVQFLLSDHKVVMQLDTKQSGSCGP